jgi:hypothetical protein
MSAGQLGLDRLGAAWRLAGVTFDAGRPQIRSLVLTENRATVDDSLAEAEAATLAVPDEYVMVKSLHLPDDQPGTVRERGVFELASGLLEPLSQYHFELIATAQPERFLGLVYRKQMLTQAQDGFQLPELPGHRMRAAALGSGYITFCRPENGDLVALADLSGHSIPVCLIYRKRIAALASISNGFGFADEVDQRRLAIELKTIINFRLSALAEEGVTVPLSRLILCGRHVTPHLIRSFGAFFPTGVTEAQVNPAFLEPSVDPAAGSASNYLVALGLAVG